MKDLEQFLGTAEQVAAMHAVLKGGCEHVVDAGTDSLTPMIGIVVTNPFSTEEPENWLLAMNTGFNSSLEKKRSMKVAAAMVYKAMRCPLAVGMTSEAWMSKQAPDEQRQYLMPADDPERKEIAMVCTINVGPGMEPTTAKHSIREMKRIEGNQIAWGEGWDDMEGVEIEANLLRQFFVAYAKFAVKQDDPEAYLAGVNTQDLLGGMRRD
jgi:hypothetical protein